MIRFLLVYLCLWAIHSFAQTDPITNCINQFQGSRCVNINSWSEPFDSSSTVLIDGLYEIYDTSSLIPYSIYQFDPSVNQYCLSSNQFLDSDSLFIQVPNENKTAVLFNDTSKPSLAIIQPRDTAARVTLFQSCVLHN